MSSLYTLTTYLKSKQVNLNSDDLRCYETILLNAINEELDAPFVTLHKMTLTPPPSSCVCDQLQKDGFQLIPDTHSYTLAWKRFLTIE